MNDQAPPKLNRVSPSISATTSPASGPAVASDDVRFAAPAPANEAAVFALERPDSSLQVYYALSSLLAGPFFLFLLIPRLIRFRTLRYRFDEEGVQMRWGILFRREIHLTYARIQDIHLVSNAIERWLGLAKIQIQTASGHSGAEMTIEGVKDYEAVRDYLYLRMRGVKEPARPTPARRLVPTTSGLEVTALAEVASALRLATEELAALRQELAEGREASDA